MANRVRESRPMHFWYVTHIKNLDSILANGIFCRDQCRAAGLIQADISDFGVQRRRELFHDSVPLFFASNTPMLYVVIKKFGHPIILLEIDQMLDLIKRPGVKYANGNVASLGTKIYDNFKDWFADTNFKILYNDEPATSSERKRIRSAEILIPNCVESQFIYAIHVQSNEIKKFVEDTLIKCERNIPVIVDLTEGGVSS
jgi:hypothetical protein